MRLLWTDEGWEDYLFWQATDEKMLQAINALIKNIRRNNPFKGLGKPEPLKYNLAGWWSRRITREHRLVCRVYGASPAQILEIAQCRYHT